MNVVTLCDERRDNWNIVTGSVKLTNCDNYVDPRVEQHHEFPSFCMQSTLDRLHYELLELGDKCNCVTLLLLKLSRKS
jgi:hypothetical protein